MTVVLSGGLKTLNALIVEFDEWLNHNLQVKGNSTELALFASQ